MDYSEVLFFVCVVLLAPFDRLSSGLAAGLCARFFPESGFVCVAFALFLGWAADFFALRRMTRPEIFQTDGAPTHLHTDTIRSLAKRHPLGTVLFLCAFGFSRRDAAAAGAALSDAALRTTLFAGALLGTLLGASAGFLAGAALKPLPLQPDLFEAAGLVCLAGLTAFTVRLLWVRLSHRWSEHENPIGRR